ncbi:MAG: diaminopimelate epimerase [Syntrophus sp. (in: bacteria)]|nr:diaminopimelate epimerase [Syntrophus sp. (in: bacteria)]
MSASGNDFIVVDNRDGKVDAMFPDIKGFIQKVCRLHHSVGADGMILIENSKEHDFRWRFFNADGSEAEMCGNGGRCAARFACITGIAKEKMAFETIAGIIKAEVTGTRVKLQLTTPSQLKLDYPVGLEDKEIFLSSVNTGVPHAVLLVDDVDYTPVEELGRLIRHHKSFGEKGTNVDFVEIIDKGNLKLRTYERGVEGETYACGTGAVAAGIILREKSLVESPVNIITRGGEILKVYINDEVYLEGDTRLIYIGTLNKEALL